MWPHSVLCWKTGICANLLCPAVNAHAVILSVKALDMGHAQCKEKPDGSELLHSNCSGISA